LELQSEWPFLNDGVLLLHCRSEELRCL
jgi:hypothetical protein